MSDWNAWDEQLLTALGAPKTAQNYAVVDAEQIVEGAGGTYNPYNIGYYGSNPQYHGYTPFGYGTPSPFPPTLDFPNSKAGIWATGKWYGSNAPDLLTALLVGNPLNPGVNWEIHMGASTPDPQYTAEVRQKALDLLAGRLAYPPEDFKGGRAGGNPAGGSGPPPSNPSGPPVLPPGCSKDPNCGLPAALASQFKNSSDPTGALGDCVGVSMGLGWSRDCASACCESLMGANAGGGVTIGPSDNCSIGGIISLPQFICDFFSALTSEAFWIRAGEVILGLVLVIIGVNTLAKKFGVPMPKTPVPGIGA